MRLTPARLLSLLLPVLCVIIGTASAYAQTAPQQQPIIPQSFAGVILTDQAQQTTLGNNFYVIPDAGRNLSNRLIQEKIVSGTFRNNLSASPIVNLGLQGITTWLVIPITNVSSSDGWELNFGDISSGRYNVLSRLSVYNSLTSKTIYDSNPQGQSPYSISNVIRFNLPVGQSGFIIIEVRSPAGSASILNLTLKRAYFADTNTAVSTVIMARIPLMVAVILLTVSIIQRRICYTAFSAAWFLIYLQVYLVNHYIFISGMPPQLLSPLLWLLIGLGLIAGLWLAEDEDTNLPGSLFGGLGFLAFICGLIGLLIASFVPLIGYFLTYGPVLIANTILVLLGTAIAIRRQQPAYFLLALSGLLMMICLGIGMTSSMLLLHSPFLLSAAGIALCLSAIFTAAYALTEKAFVMAAPETDAVFPLTQSKDLAEAKENSEHKRLLQVLEQERATMGDMQVQEARRTEEMRRAKEAADEANNAKSAFLAVVSHEIRTPMTGIMGMVRLLLDTSLSKDQKEYAGTIQDSGEALMALLNDILDFEKIESGKLELERADFDLPRLVRGVQTLMNGHANSKGVELKLELDPKVPAFFVGDSTRLRQILLNLVNNAIKFTSAKGTVYIRINDLTPDDQLQNAHQIYFAVQDSGIGISPEVQKKLFMPFAQADSSTARKYGGTGLGLAICKRLIEVMGGAISISSKSGEGATFFFTLSLPLGHDDGMINTFAGAASASGPVDTTKLVQQATKKLQILVVDDNGINQKVLTGLIEKEGHKVTTASTGAEALGKYLAATYDLVLMDIELPDRNGLEVTGDIRNLREPAKAFVPVVAMTGNTSEKDVAACFNAGMDDFLAKPINQDRLRKILSIASGNGSFANHVQKEIRQQADANANAPDITYVPMPPPAPGEENTYIPVPPPPPAAKPSPFSQQIMPQALPDSPGFSFDLGDLEDDEDDEDTFASAIRQFESIEAQSTALDSDLDEAMLNTLKTSLSVTQLDELLVGFYEKAEELVTAIGQSFLAHDLSAMGARAHELKGMAGNFGFKGVSTLSGQIEKAAKSGAEADLKSPVEHLAETYAVSKARLAAWLKE